MLDPPDEVIPKPASTSNSIYPYPPQEAAAQTPSKLNNAVSVFTAHGVWWLRTLLAIVCALGVVWLEERHQLVHSSVVLMSALDSALLLCAVLTHHPSKSTTAGNPLGKISLLKIPLTVVHSASAEWFDTVCLSVWLIALILRDVLLMMFTTIILKCFHFVLFS